MKPGTRIRVESLYDGSQKRLGMPCNPLLKTDLQCACGGLIAYSPGVMGIMAIWVSGLTNKCNFQHSMAAQPPMMGMMQNPHTTQGMSEYAQAKILFLLAGRLHYAMQVTALWQHSLPHLWGKCVGQKNGRQCSAVILSVRLICICDVVDTQNKIG